MATVDKTVPAPAGYRGVFRTGTVPANIACEQVYEIPLTELHPFENHPYRVLDDESMNETAESIREHRIQVPGIVRPRPE